MNRKIKKIDALEEIQARKRVTAYARVSCEKDEMLHSLAAQVSFYSELIQSHTEWEYAGVYADTAETGTKDNRPEFKRLIADCRAGLVDIVITKSISRFARNTVTLLETVRELKSLGISVYFEEQNIDTMSADGEMMLTILASYAQEESRSVSENCKWRIRKDFKEGHSSTNIHMYGYQFKAGVFTVIPEEAKVVRMIYADYLSGFGKNAITKKLTRLGIPTKNNRRWSEGTVSGILKNEKYLGDVLLQKGYVTDHLSKRHKKNEGELPQYYVEGNHEGIIDRATFDAVQTEIKRRAAMVSPPKERHLSEFSGVIRCGRCGARFRRKINACGTKYAKPTWACATYTYRGKGECAAKRIPEDILREKCAEALGLAEYDAKEFTAKVSSITIPDDGILAFEFHDQTQRTILWENRSRRESWTDEMKQAAREKMKGGGQNG